MLLFALQASRACPSAVDTVIALVVLAASDDSSIPIVYLQGSRIIRNSNGLQNQNQLQKH